MFNERISELESPCYDRKTKTDCPRRCAGCSTSCPDWDGYLKKRDELYRKRKLDSDVDSAIRAMTNKRVEAITRHKIRANRIKPTRK